MAVAKCGSAAEESRHLHLFQVICAFVIALHLRRQGPLCQWILAQTGLAVERIPSTIPLVITSSMEVCFLWRTVKQSAQGLKVARASSTIHTAVAKFGPAAKGSRPLRVSQVLLVFAIAPPSPSPHLHLAPLRVRSPLENACRHGANAEDARIRGPSVALMVTVA